MPLPLREYYPIERAAELLGCTIDDLIHWAEVGSIQLCIKLNNAFGTLGKFAFGHLVNYIDFNIAIKGTQYEDDLNNLEKSMREDDSYYIEKSEIIYHAMVDYINEHRDINSLSKETRFGFAQLEYLFRNYVAEDFSKIAKLNKLSHKYFLENDKLHNIGKLLRDESVAQYIVIMNGFFALDCYFFSDVNMENEITIGNSTFTGNTIYMPENNLLLDIIVDEDVNINVKDLFVLKNDFISIQKAIGDGSELSRKYFNHRGLFTMNEDNKIDLNKLSNKKPHIKELHSARRESVLRAAMYMRKNHPALCENYSYWADAIIDHAHKFWDDGECPLSQKVIAKMLSESENHSLR